MTIAAPGTTYESRPSVVAPIAMIGAAMSTEPRSRDITRS
jgi:hypothetical protein